MSSGIKTGRNKVDDQLEKKARFSKKKTGFYSRKTLDATKLGGKSIKVCKRTNLPTCKHGGDCLTASQLLKSCFRRLRKIKDMGTQMFLRRQNQSRKRFLEEALGLCVVANTRKRKERSGDEQRDSSWWRNGYLNWDDKAL